MAVGRYGGKAVGVRARGQMEKGRRPDTRPDLRPSCILPPYRRTAVPPYRRTAVPPYRLTAYVPRFDEPTPGPVHPR